MYSVNEFSISSYRYTHTYEWCNPLLWFLHLIFTGSVRSCMFSIEIIVNFTGIYHFKCINIVTSKNYYCFQEVLYFAMHYLKLY